MRITKHQTAVIARAIAEATFKPRVEGLGKEAAALARRLYDKHVTAKARKAVASLPEFLRTKLEYAYEKDARLNVELVHPCDNSEYVILTFPLKPGETVLHNFTRWNDKALRVKDVEFWPQFSQMRQRRDALRSEADRFREELAVNITAARTVEKLLAVWPEHAVLIRGLTGATSAEPSTLGYIPPKPVPVILAAVTRSLPAPATPVQAEPVETKPRAKRKPITIEG